VGAVVVVVGAVDAADAMVVVAVVVGAVVVVNATSGLRAKGSVPSATCPSTERTR
jgi:hypothetical protein